MNIDPQPDEDDEGHNQILMLFHLCFNTISLILNNMFINKEKIFSTKPGR